MYRTQTTGHERPAAFLFFTSFPCCADRIWRWFITDYELRSYNLETIVLFRQGPGLYRKKSENFGFNSFCYTLALWRSWLRQCARSRKVAGSIPVPDGVGIFYWHNLSDRTTALGTTPPLTEMSTRNVSWGVNAFGVCSW